ncbi:MAG: glycosyltransferase family 2 protein [Cytophagales bacterium]|nr:glycosyltransferase family 2 protein [Cytophaga sp.]
MAENTFQHAQDYQDVAAIITAMTHDEKYFLSETLHVVFIDPCIGQIILCVEEKTDWLDSVIGPFLSDPRLSIIRIPMMPIGGVRNKALQYVDKPWIAYCDGDDVWCSGKTLIQRNYANQTGADFIGTGHYLMNEAGSIRGYGLSIFIPMLSSWMVRTDIMRRYPFNEMEPYGSDGEWWITTANTVQKTKCPEVLLRYRVRLHSVSSVTPSKKRKMRLINISSLPVIGPLIRFVTYCLWLITKHQPYRWFYKWSR